MNDVRWWGDMLVCECLLGLSQKPSPQLAAELIQIVLDDYMTYGGLAGNLLVKDNYQSFVCFGR